MDVIEIEFSDCKWKGIVVMNVPVYQRTWFMMDLDKNMRYKIDVRFRNLYEKVHADYWGQYCCHDGRN